MAERGGFVQSMKAVCLQAPGKIVLEDRPVPRPNSGEALLQVLYGGICGSDLGAYRGGFSYSSYPRVPGHEFSAEIIELSGKYPGISPGMTVTCNPYFNCGSCYSCQRGLRNACMDNRTMGVQREGAFSEYITMPVERICPGGGLPPRTLALIEPFCIGYHAVNRAGIHPGERVLIMGAGTIGTLAALAVKMLGGEVWICDIAPAKVEYAVGAFGLCGGIYNASPEAFRYAVCEATGEGPWGVNGFDVVVEATGQSGCLSDCVDAAAFGGRVVEVGVPQKPAQLHHQLIQKKELNIFGSRNALQQDFLDLITLVGEQGIPLERVITAVYPVSEAPRAFSDFSQKHDETLKILLDFTQDS